MAKEDKVENRITIAIKETQVGDLIIYGPLSALIDDPYEDVKKDPSELITEQVIGVSINLPYRTVDLRTTNRAVFDVPMNLEIDIIRN